MMLQTAKKHIQDILFKLRGGIIGAFTTLSIQLARPIKWFRGSRKQRESTSNTTVVNTKYMTWKQAGGTTRANLITSSLVLFGRYQMPHRPYANSKRSGGANYYASAFQTWAMIGLCLFLTKDFWGMFLPNPEKGQNMMFAINGTEVAPTGAMMVPGLGALPTATPGLIQPTFTPYPTYTPYPTENPYPISMHKFSFYDPMIGKDKPEIALINCESWNYTTLYCDSKMRNGEEWKDNYFIAAACPYDLYMAGAFFEVASPNWLATLFPQGVICKDTGEAVTGLFIDFLIPWQSMPMAYDKTPWGTPIALRRIK